MIRFLVMFAVLALCLYPTASRAGLLYIAFIVPAVLAGLYTLATRKEA